MAAIKVEIYNPNGDLVYPKTIAENVLLVDTGNKFSSTNIENALQEVALLSGATFTGAIGLAASTGLIIQSGAPGTTTNTLYQVGSALYFNGAAVGGGGGTGFGDISTKTADYTVLTTDGLLLCNAASGGFTITLTASPGSKQQIVIKKTDATTNSVVINGNSKTIDGSTSIYINKQNNSFSLIYDGTNWQVI